MDAMENLAVIGLGYVGLPLALAFAKSQVKVIGIDIDEGKIDQIARGETLISTLDKGDLERALSSGNLRVSTSYSLVKEASAILICVPTPLDKNLAPDLSYIRNTCDQMAEYIQKGHLISLESTSYPGTTREVIIEMVNNQGLEPGLDVNIVYSPEREDPGNKHYSTVDIPKVIAGFSTECLSRGKKIYEKAFANIHSVSSLETAEMTKIVENVQRCVNISLMNEMKLISMRMGIDIYEVIEAASTKPFGFTPFYPGPGMGGHCIPIDPFYLSWKAKELGMDARFIELAGVINREMPGSIVKSIEGTLNSIQKPVNGSRIQILGIAYKKNIDDLRESPALEIIKLLIEKKAEVRFIDPYFSEIPQTRRYKFEIKGVPLSAESLKWADANILVTDHDSFDYSQ